MPRILLPMLLFMCAGHAGASTCPDFFRFVDFGQQGSDGVVYRGGSLFRAENFDGNMLLQLESTECLPIKDTAKDGRGNPIPVVTSIAYMPKQAGSELTSLQIKKVEDTNTIAEKNAELHRGSVKEAAGNVWQGSDYLCAPVKVNGNTEGSVSCQVVSPYTGNTALVVYCDAQQCKMPVMAVDSRITVNATWMRLTDEDDTGPEIVEMTNKIHQFLSPLTSLNPG